jgi:hypothetical protein
MTDDEFKDFLPHFTHALHEFGFDNMLTFYISTLKDIHYDWDALVKKNVDQNHISATSVVGTSIIKTYMTHLYDVENHKGMSIRKAWTYNQLLKAVDVNRRTHETPYASELIRQLGFTCGMSKVTVYRPLLTKRIVQFFNASNVLDVCVGWGGRMLGACCVNGCQYTGIEPQSLTFAKLNAMKQDLDLSGATLHHGKAETILPSLNRSYDLALTSPPYYNLEIYSDENTQSHFYGSYEQWVQSFLKPVILGVLSKLIDGGKSLWSVKNIRTDKSYGLLDDVINIHEEAGWQKNEVEFYVGNSVRPGLKPDNNGNARKGQEITYVFTKK